MSKPGTSLKGGPAPVPEGSGPYGEELLRAFNGLRDELVSTLWFILGNRDDAQETAQETFLKCWRSQDSLREVKDLRAWIFRVGLNAAKDLRRSAWSRRSKLFRGDDVMLMGKEAPPAQIVENQEAVERLRLAILNLRQEEKEVFLLRQNGDLTYEQIAAIRHSPIGTVKTQMRSALQKLRQQLA